jgi:hypothetical protein
VTISTATKPIIIHYIYKATEFDEYDNNTTSIFITLIPLARDNLARHTGHD